MSDWIPSAQSDGRVNGAGTCIVGVGARTSIGLQAFSSAIACHAGISQIQEHPYMRDKAGEPFMVALDGSLEQHDRLERLLALARTAVEEVVSWLPLSPDTRVPVYVGLPEFGRHFDSQSANAVARSVSDTLSGNCRAEIEVVAEGNAAGVVGLERAIRTINERHAECCIVGGVDSFVDPDILEMLDKEGRLQSASNRWGFPPGEGAGMLAVCSQSFARREHLRVLGSVTTVVTTFEEKCMNADSICVGEGLGEAFARAGADCGGMIGRQYCDVNGERYREREFAYAILRVPERTFVDGLDYVAPADCWGHTGAATGPLLALIPIVMNVRGFDVAPRPMVWCGSESGRRGAIVIELTYAATN